MNKTQLVDALTERLGDRRTATTAVEGLLETIVDTVRSGDSVSLTGFGVFEGRARAARTARNPRTGEAVDVPATTVPAFRPGAAFRSAVGGSGAAAPRSAPTRSSAAAVAAEPEAAAPAEKPTRRKATPKTTAKATAKPTEEAAPEATPKSRTRSAKVGSSFAASADQPEKSAKAEKSAKPEKAEKATKNGNGKAKPAGRSGEKSGKADDKAKKAKGKK